MDSALTCFNKASTNIVNFSFPRLPPRFILQVHLLSPRGVQGKPSPTPQVEKGHIWCCIWFWVFIQELPFRMGCEGHFCTPKRLRAVMAPLLAHWPGKGEEYKMEHVQPFHEQIHFQELVKALHKAFFWNWKFPFSNVRIIWLYIGSRKGQSQIPPAPKDGCNHVCHHLVKGMLH